MYLAQIANLPSNLKQLPGVPFLPRKTLKSRGDVTYPRSHEGGQAQALCSDGSYPAPAAAPGLDSLVPTSWLSIPLPTPCLKSQGPRQETETIDCSIRGLGKPNSSLPSPPLSRGLPLQVYVGQIIRLMESWLPVARGVDSPPLEPTMVSSRSPAQPNTAPPEPGDGGGQGGGECQHFTPS